MNHDSNQRTNHPTKRALILAHAFQGPMLHVCGRLHIWRQRRAVGPLRRLGRDGVEEGREGNGGARPRSKRRKSGEKKTEQIWAPELTGQG
ncbi:hypothetical protein L484_025835 [Morus notabilis]|uniref:Uncharacterized protein n=1 Tax=Morus notabilis TaxID=981085 RepID=W9RAP7_9ROSA|nr:hypothetical protein L484_025835 [Morus notabilis]